MTRAVVVIGVGNALRGDDAAGLEVVRQLGDLGPRAGADVCTSTHEGEGVGLIELWDGADAVVLVDCMRSGAAPGTVLRIDASSAASTAPLRRTSSHLTSVGEAIELARALGRLPRTAVVYGIEGVSFALGAELSADVKANIEPAARAVRREVQRLLADRRLRPLTDVRRPPPRVR